MDNLDKSLEYLLESEGGWSNHPADRGGATMYGVTQGTYDVWRKSVNRVRQSVRNISHEEARQLYDIMYWRAASCDKLPWPICYLVFDAAVNSGVNRSVRWLQAGLSLSQDGKVGPKTIEAARKVVDEADARKIVQIVDARLTFLVRLVQRSASQAAFLLGWMRRIQMILAVALVSIED